MVDFTRQLDMKGTDEVVAVERTRATLIPVSLTGTYQGNGGTSATYTTNAQGTAWYTGFGIPRSASISANTTALAADMLTGIITIKNTTAGTLNFTLDSASNIITALNSISSGAQIGDCVSFLLINSTSSTGGGTLTMAVPASGSFDANQTAPVLAVGSSRYVNVILSNVTTSPAYVVYV